MSALTVEYACYTGQGQACWAGMYEELLDRLTATIGPDHARAAFHIIGAHASRMGSTQMLSSLLKAYGDHLTEVATETTPNGSHSRRSPLPVT